MEAPLARRGLCRLPRPARCLTPGSSSRPVNPPASDRISSLRSTRSLRCTTGCYRRLMTCCAHAPRRSGQTQPSSAMVTTGRLCTDHRSDPSPAVTALHCGPSRNCKCRLRVRHSKKSLPGLSCRRVRRHGYRTGTKGNHQSCGHTFLRTHRIPGRNLRAQRPVMLLIADQLRVALITTHLPLRAVADAITGRAICEVIEILDHDLRSRFGLSNRTSRCVD